MLFTNGLQVDGKILFGEIFTKQNDKVALSTQIKTTYFSCITNVWKQKY